MSITAMKAALDALEWGNEPMARDAITALRAAISEQEQCEPAQQFRYKFLDRAALDAWIAMNTHPAPAPAGWQLVPVEPTEEMRKQMHYAYWQTPQLPFHDRSPELWNATYKAMLQAAPKPGEMK